MSCSISGHWVDFLSLYKLRTDLDRARVLFDCVLRREKVKKDDRFTTSIYHHVIKSNQ